jgi:hypothetical protein
MKTCEQIIFQVRPGPGARKELFNGKPVHMCWPKLPHHDQTTALHWASGAERVNGKTIRSPGFTISMPNNFTGARVDNDIDVRGQSARVPSAMVYCEEKDCYLAFDFRTDGLVETLVNYGVDKGEINTPMSFTFTGTNYYFVPRNGTSFTEYKKSFEQAAKPKTKASTIVEIGVPFVGAYDLVYTYLGEFDCVQDDTTKFSDSANYNGSKVHVYADNTRATYGAGRSDESFTIIKSKMKVKSLVIDEAAEVIKFKRDKHIVITGYGSKAGCGFSSCELEVDFVDRTVKFVEAERRQWRCW